MENGVVGGCLIQFKASITKLWPFLRALKCGANVVLADYVTGLGRLNSDAGNTRLLIVQSETELFMVLVIIIFEQNVYSRWPFFF